MNMPEVLSQEEADAALEERTRQHYKATLLIAALLVVCYVIAQAAPPVSEYIAMTVGPALGMTLMVSVMRESFRSRSGSMTPAICLIAFMWIMAVVVSVMALAGQLV